MQYPDDDFLADVAPLGQADRAILDTGFERNRVVVHVDAERGPPPLDAARRLRPRRPRSTPPELRSDLEATAADGGDDDIEAAHTELIARQQDERRAERRTSSIAIERHGTKRVWRVHALPHAASRKMPCE